MKKPDNESVTYILITRRNLLRGLLKGGIQLVFAVNYTKKTYDYTYAYKRVSPPTKLKKR